MVRIFLNGCSRSSSVPSGAGARTSTLACGPSRRWQAENTRTELCARALARSLCDAQVAHPKCEVRYHASRSIAHLLQELRCHHWPAKLPSFMQTELNEWLENANTALTAIKKDNDLIYNERVPSLEDLSVIKGTILVKAAPFQQKFLNDQSDIFARMPILDPSAKKSECVVS